MNADPPTKSLATPLIILLFVASLAAGGFLVWCVGDPHSLLPTSAAVRAIIFIVLTAITVDWFSDPSRFPNISAPPLVRVGIGCGAGALLGAFFMASAAPGFGNGVEPITDSAILAAGIVVFCYYIYAARKFPQAARQIDIPFYMALLVVAGAAFSLYISHADHRGYLSGAGLRIALQSLLWQSLRMSRKFLKDHTEAQPPAGQAITT